MDKIMDKPILTLGWGVLAVGVSMSGIIEGLQIAALIVPTLYASWRWYRDWRKTK